MLFKSLAVIAIVLFVISVIAVLQGWSQGKTSDHVIGLAFIAVFGIAAAWGVRTLGLLPH